LSSRFAQAMRTLSGSSVGAVETKFARSRDESDDKRRSRWVTGRAKAKGQYSTDMTQCR
jgi:hypothetical protein